MPLCTHAAEVSTNRNAPTREIRFVCSGCGVCARFVCEVRKHAAARMRASGWTILEGESRCDRCEIAGLLEDMRKSTAPAANAAVPISSRYPKAPETDSVETVRPMAVAS